MFKVAKFGVLCYHNNRKLTNLTSMLLNFKLWNYGSRIGWRMGYKMEKFYKQILFPYVSNTSTYISQNKNCVH